MADPGQRGNGPAAPIHSLPDELLIDILAWLPSSQLRCIAPLVCRRWAAIASGPSELWESTSIDLRDEADFPAPALLLAADWFARRAAAVCELALVLPRHASGLAVVVTGALARAGGKSLLRELHVSFQGGHSQAGADLLAALGRHTRIGSRLEKLSLANLSGPLLQGYLGGPIKLPRLRSFVLDFTEDPANITLYDNVPDFLPDGLPSFLLDCSKLESLAIISAGPESLQTLPEGLVQLLRLHTLCLLHNGIERLPISLAQLTSLEVLEVVNWDAQHLLQHIPSLAALTQLQAVKLLCERLPVLPPSLKTLALWGVRSYDADKEAEWAQLLDGLKLKRLDLSFCPLQTLPAAVTRQTALRTLLLEHCQLTALPSGPYLRHLAALDARGNPFLEVPAAALTASHLAQLIVTGAQPPLDARPGAGSAAEQAEAVAAVNAQLQQLAGEEVAEAAAQRFDDRLFQLSEAIVRGACRWWC